MFRSRSRGDLHTGSEALLGWPSTLSLRLMRLFARAVRAATVQRCWAAYALHGRHVSALESTSAALGRLPLRLLDPAKGLMTATKSGPLNLDETREGSCPIADSLSVQQTRTDASHIGPFSKAPSLRPVGA